MLESLGALRLTSLHFSLLTCKGDTHLTCLQELRLFMLPTLESVRTGLVTRKTPPTKKTLAEPKCGPWGIPS